MASPDFLHRNLWGRITLCAAKRHCTIPTSPQHFVKQPKTLLRALLSSDYLLTAMLQINDPQNVAVLAANLSEIVPFTAFAQSLSHLGISTAEVSPALRLYRSLTSKGFFIPMEHIPLNHHIVCRLKNDDVSSGETFYKVNSKAVSAAQHIISNCTISKRQHLDSSDLSQFHKQYPQWGVRS